MAGLNDNQPEIQGGTDGTIIGNTGDKLKVDGSGVTQPVSGTVAVTQSTSPWVINLTQVGGSSITLAQKTSANSFPIVIASDQSAIPVSQSGTWNINNISGTISLPTGASTSALQTTGNTSLSTIATNTGSLILAQGSTTSGQTGNLAMGAVTTAAPTYTTGQTDPLSLTTTGALRTDSSGTTQPVSGTVTSNQGTANTAANGWTVKPTDGTNSQSYTASGESKVLVTPLTNSSIVKAQLQDNAGTGLTSTLVSAKQSLDVNVVNSFAAGVADKSTFTYGTTVESTIGGVYQDTSPSLTAGQQGATRLTANRAFHVNVRDASGNEKLGSSTSANSLPVVIASDQSAIPVTLPTDVLNATSNITTQDLASSTTTGFGGQSFIIGTPTANSSASLTINSIQTVMVEIIGLWTGTLSIEVSSNGGTIWNTRGAHLIGTSLIVSSITSNITGSVNVAAQTQIRVRATSAITGTAIVQFLTSDNLLNFYLANPVRLIDSSSSTSTTTMYIKAASTAPVATDNAIVVALSPNGNQATTANQTNGTQTTRITDGTNTGTVKAASTASIAADTSLVVALSPNSPASATATTGQPSYSNGTVNPFNANLSGALRVDASSVQVPVVGTGSGGSPNGGVLSIQGVSGGTVVPVSLSGGATAANQTTEITALQILDDVPSAQNGAFVKGTPIMGQLDDTSTTAATEDNVAAVRITAQRGLHTNLRNSSGTEFTSTATAGTTTSKQSLDVTLVPGALSYYSLPVNIRQTAGTAANATVFAMRNAAASTKTVYIERIMLLMSFDTATALGRSLQRYDLVRFSAATPTGGTAGTVVSQDSSNAATGVTDARFLDTGLTTTSVSFGTAFATIGCPATDATTTQFVREGIAFKLAPGEGFCIRLSVTAVLGQGLTGEVVWSER